MEKIEYNEVQKIIYCCTKKDPFIIDVPSMNYLCFNGAGHPSGTDFQLACEALYTLSYIIKFEISRKQFNMDYKVNPMEVKWFLNKTKEKVEFTWTMMIMQPDFITSDIIDDTIKIAIAKGKNIAKERVFFQKVDFGRSVQCFHRGDYNNMNETLEKMKNYASKNGYNSDQYTHDIYLNDMRKTKVENYKTIMRIKIYDK